MDVITRAAFSNDSLHHTEGVLTTHKYVPFGHPSLVYSNVDERSKIYTTLDLLCTNDVLHLTDQMFIVYQYLFVEVSCQVESKLSVMRLFDILQKSLWRIHKEDLTTHFSELLGWLSTSRLMVMEVSSTAHHTYAIHDLDSHIHSHILLQKSGYCGVTQFDFKM